MKYLVIVESPAKIKKIQSILGTIKGHTFIVEASYGHIRYFKNGLKSIDIANNYTPTYSIIKDKLKVVKKLRTAVKKVDEIIIATDNDREGEAIGYHLIKSLNKSVSSTKRMYFNEITKPAILDAFHNLKTLNMDQFYAQQARSILDLLIGFKISPLLWRHIKEKLSAGRCQTPALKLVYERENEINSFTPQGTYKLMGKFKVGSTVIDTIYHKELKNKSLAISNMNRLVTLQYRLTLKDKKKVGSNPPPPFITSTIQQTASSLFNMSPKNTMSVLQKLYEGGKITYMRTDSPAISKEFIKISKQYIKDNFGNFTPRKYKSKSKNAQEAHECIRPVLLDIHPSDISDSFARKLYELIWKRTIACFLPEYIEEHYIFHLYPNKNEYFYTTKKITLQKGFKQIYSEVFPNDIKDINKLTVQLKKSFKPEELSSFEKYTKPKPLYTEATLVKALEHKGIGRPSTFSNIVNTLLTRKYVIKENRKLPDINLVELYITPATTIKETSNIKLGGSAKNKLYMTQLGRNVIDYLCKHFNDNICSYGFTADINDQLDLIVTNSKTWYTVVDHVYNIFIAKVNEQTKQIKSKKEINKILVGSENDIKYYYYTDNYGIVFLKENGDVSDKRRSKNNNSESELNISIIKESFKYPIKKGSYKGEDVLIKKGPYGLYCEIGKNKFSIEDDGLSLTALLEKLKQKNKSILKQWDSLSILNGPYGPYIKKGKKNYPLDKGLNLDKLTKKKCLEIIKNHTPKKRFNKHLKK